jgi:hypothetical protein
MSDAIIFLGPTLPVADARELLDADYRPPVAQGDVIRAVAEQPKIIAIVDGYFEAMPSVWHKEILHALSRGIRVFGASSMGALRAAELAPFGMTGIGAIFEAYVDGRLEDDDEVAVTHGPAEIGYPALSEAMVNIRRTLSDAFSRKVIDDETRCLLEELAKELPYKDRSYAAILRQGSEAGLEAGQLDALKRWLPTGRADQKREDALAMLKAVRQALTVPMPLQLPNFPFEHTTMWDRAARAATGQRA